MQLSPKIKNNSLIWSPLLKVRVGTVVNVGGSYYYNTSGKNSTVTDDNNWFQIFSTAGSTPLPLDKASTDIDGDDPDFYIDLSADGLPAFPLVLKVYLDIEGDDSFILLEPTVYNPVTKVLSGLSSPVDFPNQKLKILFL